MADKHLVLFEDKQVKYDQSIIKGTRIIAKIEGTDEVVFDTTNKVMIAGSAFTAAKHFNITPKVKTPTYNELLGLDYSIRDVFDEPGLRRDELIYLFAVGRDGCGIENSQVYDVNYTKPISIESLVPFKYQLPENDTVNRKKYFGRKTTNDRIIYYFKAFENDPVFKQQYIDGTSIDENIYTSKRSDAVSSFVELKLKLTTDDCRDFFSATTGINDAKVNSISLLSAYPIVMDDGYVYYQNIRPITKLHFPNEPLIDLRKGLDITYHIYY